MMPPDAILWIDEIERAHRRSSPDPYPLSISRVFHKLFARACRLRTNRIDITVTELAKEISAHPDSIRLTARQLHAHGLDFSLTPKGLRGSFPAEWCPQPLARDERTLMLPLGAVDNPDHNPGPQDHNPGPQDQLGPIPQDQKRRNGETTPVGILGPRKNLLGPRKGLFNTLLGTKEDWPKNQYVTALVAGKNSQAPGPQGVRVEVDSKKLEEPSSLRSTDRPSAVQGSPEIDGPSLGRGVIDRILAARTVENPEDAATIAQCLFSHMRKFGPPDRKQKSLEDLLKDDLLLARIDAIAPLGGPDAADGTLIHTFRQLDLEYKPCGREYGWFVSTLANRIHGTDPKELAAALDKARLRRKPKPPSNETAARTAAENPEFGKQLIHQVAGAGRKLR